MSQFDSYYQSIQEPEKKQKYNNWSISKGLQQVDGLSTSPYLDKIAADNIEGRLSAADAVKLVDSYYQVKAGQNEIEAYKEADMVSVRINEILENGGFTLSVEELKDIHRQLFERILENAGEFRPNNIFKREWVLDGGSVTYGDARNIIGNIEGYIRRERVTRYSSLDDEAIFWHLARFVSDIWRTHPFSEGNTRTTAVFAIKYFRSMGFEIDNTPFLNNSWYFRNALVRANYTNIPKKVDSDLSYLEEFLFCALTGKHGIFRNRDLHIYSKRTGFNLSPSGNDLDKTILHEINKDITITRKALAEKTLTSEKTIERHLKSMGITFTGPSKTGHWVVPVRYAISTVGYEEIILDDMIDKMEKTFKDGPFEGLSVKFDGYDPSRPLSELNPRVISEFVFRSKQGIHTWDISDGSLSELGWRTFQNGSKYNIKTGQVRFLPICTLMDSVPLISFSSYTSFSIRK